MTQLVPFMALVNERRALRPDQGRHLLTTQLPSCCIIPFVSDAWLSFEWLDCTSCTQCLAVYFRESFERLTPLVVGLEAHKALV